MKNLKRRIILKELVKEYLEKHVFLEIILAGIVLVIIGAIIGFKLTKPIKLTSKETACYKEIAEELLGNTGLKDLLSKKEKYESDFKCSIDFDVSEIEVTLFKSIKLTSEEITCYNEIIEELQKDTELKDISSKIEKCESDFECSINCNVSEIEVTSKDARKESIIFKISSKGDITSNTSLKEANFYRLGKTFLGGALGFIIWYLGIVLLILVDKCISNIKEAYNKKLKEIEEKEKLQLEQHEEEEETKETE